MRVMVAGTFDKGVILDTTQATAVLIDTDDGQPTVVFKILEDGKGWLRLVKGEDENFGAVVKELGLTR